MNLCFAGLSPAISGMFWEHPLNPEPPRSPQPTTRWERTGQATLFNVFAEHEIGRELKAMSQCLDEQRLLLGLIAADLRGHGIKETGRHGLPAEAVLRCALLKQKSATELHGIGLSSGGVGVVSRLRPLATGMDTKEVGAATDDRAISDWEAINRGSAVRIDSTVTEA